MSEKRFKTVQELIDYLEQYKDCELDLQGEYRTWVIPSENTFVILPLKENPNDVVKHIGGVTLIRC